MVIVTDIFGRPSYFRCTADGRLQSSEDAKCWRVMGGFRGKRANMGTQTTAGIEAVIARRLKTSDWAMSVQIE